MKRSRISLCSSISSLTGRHAAKYTELMLKGGGGGTVQKALWLELPSKEHTYWPAPPPTSPADMRRVS